MERSEKNNLKFEKYVTLLNFKRADLRYHKKEHEERKIAFNRDAAEFMKQNNFSLSHDKCEKNFINVYEREKNVPNAHVDAECDKIYKQVAKLTHPDKNITEDKGIRDIRKKVFLESKKANKNKDWFTLYSHALDLGLSLPKITQPQIAWMESEVKKLDSLMDKVRTTLEWLYCEQNTNKHAILTTYCMTVCDKIE